jgi:hypothetical protein
MKLFGLPRLLLAVPLLAVAAAAAAASIDVDATPVASANATVEETAEVAPDVSFVVSNCTYYNNASHSQVVGQFGYDCCNNLVQWGRKTQYSSCGGCFPCFPPPR